MRNQDFWNESERFHATLKDFYNCLLATSIKTHREKRKIVLHRRRRKLSNDNASSCGFNFKLYLIFLSIFQVSDKRVKCIIISVKCVLLCLFLFLFLSFDLFFIKFSLFSWIEKFRVVFSVNLLFLMWFYHICNLELSIQHKGKSGKRLKKVYFLVYPLYITTLLLYKLLPFISVLFLRNDFVLLLLYRKNRKRKRYIFFWHS